MTPATVGTWVNTVGSETVVPLINLMNDDLLAEPVVAIAFVGLDGAEGLAVLADRVSAQSEVTA